MVGVAVVVAAAVVLLIGVIIVIIVIVIRCSQFTHVHLSVSLTVCLSV